MNPMNIRTIGLRRATALLAVCLKLATANAADDLSQAIQASADGHFLTQPDGTPFFWLGDTAWELFYRLDRDETERYLQDRARKGFNVIQVVATGKLDYEGLKDPNREGEVPFIASDPRQPNARYFEHVDWVVDRAAHYGLRVALVPVWGAFFVDGGPSRVFDAANAEEYGRWIAHRYRGKGIIWVLGGDTNPLSYDYPKFKKDDTGWWVGVGDKTVVDYRPVYDAMAKGIIAGDGGHPFITYHPTAGSPSGAAIPRMSLYFGDRRWLDMSMLQSSHLKLSTDGEEGGTYSDSGDFVWNATLSYLPIAAEYQATPSRPVIDGESRYEDHPKLTINGDATEFWRSQDSGHAVYHSLFAGAAGYTYGDFTIWDFYDPNNPISHSAVGGFERFFSRYVRTPWQQALSAPGAGQMQYAKALMLSRPYFSRIPDQTLIVGESGRGDQHIGATRDASGTYAMIYLPQGQPVTVDLSKIKGSHAVGWWFNPREGVATKIDGSIITTRKASFVPPTHGADQDWVLILDGEDSHFAVPGGKK